jgi:hypothetical protein
LLEKKVCSPDEKMNDSPQSRQVSVRSWNTFSVPPDGAEAQGRSGALALSATVQPPVDTHQEGLRTGTAP